MATYSLKPNTSNAYVEGNLQSSPSGDWSLIYKGKISSYPIDPSFGNLFAICDTSGSGDYIGIALDATNTNKLKIISNGATPGVGTTIIDLDTDYEIKLTYTQSTNTAEIFIDNVSEYSVNPTSGTSWIPNCDVYRLLSGNGLTSFGDAYIYDGTEFEDISTPANTITLNPSSSNGTGLVLPDDGVNGNDGTLINFTNDDSQWELEGTGIPTVAAETKDTPNITTTAVQGFCRDDEYFYIFDSTYGSSSNEIKKVRASTGEVVATNSSPFSGLGAGTWKLNDGCVSNGVIYNPVQDTVGGTKTVTRYSAETLAYISHTDLTSDGVYNAGCCIGHTGNLMFVGFSQASEDVRGYRVSEVEIDGTFVANHSLDAEIIGMQGITYDGTDYIVTTHDTVNSFDGAYKFDTSYTVIEKITLDAGLTETEGVEYYNGAYYYNDIEEIPKIFGFSLSSSLNIMGTETPDGTYSFDVYNNQVKTLIDTRNITFSGDSATTIVSDLAGSEILIVTKGANPPTTGLAYIGVTE